MRYWLVLMLVALLPQLAGAVEFDESTRSLALGRAAQVFEDVSGEATISDVSAPAMSEYFRPLDSETLNAGFSNSAFWVRVDLRYLPRDIAAHRDWLVELAYPPMDYVDFYLPDATGTQQLAWQTGDMLPFTSRQIKQNNYLFEVPLIPGQNKTVYLRVKSSGSIQVPLSLWDNSAYLEEQPPRMYVLGVLYGVLLVMLVYNLCIYLCVRDTSYLYYVLYIAPFGLYQLALNGVGVEFLWPHNPWLANVAPLFLLMMSILFACQFSRSFLKTRKIGVWLDSVLILLMAAAGVVMLLALSPNNGLALRLSGGLVLVFSVMIFVAGIAAMFYQVREARYFVLAWAAFLLGSAIHVGMLMGYVPHTFFSMYANQIGSALEAALLSMALAVRINQNREEHAQLMHQARENLERANQQLAASNRLKDEFLATLTHELRTPMNGVIGSLELMQTVELDQELASYHQTAASSAQDMMGMVNGILTLTELQAGRIHVVNEAFDLRSLLLELKGRFGGAARNKGLKLVSEWVEPVRTNVIGDAGKLRQCLECLLDNAIKFTQSGTVMVRIQEQRQAQPETKVQLLIEVIDSGVGFARLDESTLYQHFFQVDGSLTRQYGGLGIGLAICRKLIELQGGRLSHSSEPGKGSCFALSVVLEPVAQTIETTEWPMKVRSSS
jgi:signal transduction histidine kinase